MFPWREQNKAPLSWYWKWGHSPWCGSLSVSERMTKEGSKETVQVYTTTSIVTTEHFDVAIKTHWSLDMLTYLCKESLSSWPQKKGLFILILWTLLIFVLFNCQMLQLWLFLSMARVDVPILHEALLYFNKCNEYICFKRKKKIVILIFSRTVEPTGQPPPKLHLSLDSGSTSSRPPPGPATWCLVTPRGIRSPLKRQRGRLSVYWRGIGRWRLPSAAFSLSPGRLFCLAVGVHSHRTIKRQELQLIIDISLTSNKRQCCRGACRRSGPSLLGDERRRDSQTLGLSAQRRQNISTSLRFNLHLGLWHRLGPGGRVSPAGSSKIKMCFVDFCGCLFHFTLFLIPIFYAW